MAELGIALAAGAAAFVEVVEGLLVELAVAAGSEGFDGSGLVAGAGAVLDGSAFAGSALFVSTLTLLEDAALAELVADAC